MQLSRSFAAALVVLLAFSLLACSSGERLTIVTSDARHGFNVEIVDTPESRAQGLMFRQELADDAGMLFDFQEEREVGFWMRNTFIPLDMIFIAEDGEIMHIHENARPHDTTSIPSRFPVRFVLEIIGGRSSELGIEPGDRVEHRLIEYEN